MPTGPPYDGTASGPCCDWRFGDGRCGAVHSPAQAGHLTSGVGRKPEVLVDFFDDIPADAVLRVESVERYIE